MALKVKVKVGNITNLSDARYCAGMGVDWLGFQAGSVDAKAFEDITGWVTGPAFVMELTTDTPLQDLKGFAVDAVEIPFARIADVGVLSYSTLLLNLTMNEWLIHRTQVISLAPKVSILVFSVGLENEMAENEVLTEASKHFEILIGFPAMAERIPAHLLERVGFSLEGSSEMRPGLKDYQSLADVLEKLEID